MEDLYLRLRLALFTHSLLRTMATCTHGEKQGWANLVPVNTKTSKCQPKLDSLMTKKLKLVQLDMAIRWL